MFRYMWSVLTVLYISCVWIATASPLRDPTSDMEKLSGTPSEETWRTPLSESVRNPPGDLGQVRATRVLSRQVRSADIGQTSTGGPASSKGRLAGVRRDRAHRRPGKSAKSSRHCLLIDDAKESTSK